MKKLFRIALLNPNTSAATTDLMFEIAQRAAPQDVLIEPKTMQKGPAFIADEETLSEASQLVLQAGIAAEQDGVDGLIVAGFGDPGLIELREAVNIPVTGIAEAGMAAAAKGGRKFSIITTTPDLKKSIENTAIRYGHADTLMAVHITNGEIGTVMADYNLMTEALLNVAKCSAENDGIEAILIGGGPLASSAGKIAKESTLPIIEPVVESVLLSVSRIIEGGSLH